MSQALLERIRMILHAHLRSSYDDLATILRDGAASASELQLRQMLDECKAALGLLLVQEHHEQKRSARLQAEIDGLNAKASLFVRQGDDVAARKVLAQQIDLEQQLPAGSPERSQQILLLTDSIETMQKRLQQVPPSPVAKDLQELDELVRDSQLEQRLAALRKDTSDD
jgi:hypothetical protein